MKFIAHVIGSPDHPIAAGEPHVLVPKLVKFLEEHPRYVVVVRRKEGPRRHTHHLRLRDGRWTIESFHAEPYRPQPESRAEERERLTTVFTNLNLTIHTGAST